MKKNNETVATNNANMISVCGIITFVKELTTKEGKVWGFNIGVKVPYKGNNGKDYSAYPAFLVPFTSEGTPEKGDNVELTAHFETHKYNEKFNTTFVVDTIK